MLKGSLEDNALTMLVWSETHAPALVLQLEARLFSTKTYRHIAEKTIEYIQAYGKPPAVHLRDILEDDLRRGEEGKLLARVLEDMDALHPHLQPDYVLAELGRFIASRKLALAIEEASDALHAGDLEAAERAIYQREVARASAPGIWLHDTDAMLAFLNERESDFFPSGIEIFDQRGVRPERGEMFLIIGAKKIGKSWWAIQIGKEAILHRKKVLHITLENSERITSQRYLQALFAMTKGAAETIRVPIFKKDALGRATSFDFDTRTPLGINIDNRNKIVDKLRAFKSRPRLLIKEFPTGSLTIPHLLAYLDSLERAENFRPDLIIVDSGNRLAMRAEHLRMEMMHNFIQLRGIASSRDLAMVTTTHTNRGGDMAKLATGAAHVGEDYSILGTADTVCIISRTVAERQIGLARILVDAARNVDDKWIAMISQNYPTGQFCIDSVYMNKHLDEEIDRFSGEEEAA